jgi:hypothetical protein
LPALEHNDLDGELPEMEEYLREPSVATLFNRGACRSIATAFKY